MWCDQYGRKMTQSEHASKTSCLQNLSPSSVERQDLKKKKKNRAQILLKQKGVICTEEI